jgi:very-short-patch-repair endonuclease
MTKAEVRLWMRLKRMRADGCHFRRQAPFRGYFLDFVCFGRKLVIELDGWRHAEAGQAQHDNGRDAVLRR